MSVGKISNRKKPWYFSVRYTDDEGNTKQKKKEGFATRREALEAERTFISEQENKHSYRHTFKDDVKEYMEYCQCNKKLKASTLETKHNMIEKHILPYFGDMLTANITKVDVLSWQTNSIFTILFSPFKVTQNAYLRGIRYFFNNANIFIFSQIFSYFLEFLPFPMVK